MKTHEIKGYFYKGSLGEGHFDIKIVVPKGAPKKIEQSEHYIPSSEIERLEQQISLNYFCSYYPKVQEGIYIPDADTVEKIMDILNVNQTELSVIMGCHKASISNILKGKTMSVSFALLLFERLAIELSFPGMTRAMIDGKKPPKMDRVAMNRINETRRSAFNKKAA